MFCYVFFYISLRFGFELRSFGETVNTHTQLYYAKSVVGNFCFESACRYCSFGCDVQTTGEMIC